MKIEPIENNLPHTIKSKSEILGSTGGHTYKANLENNPQPVLLKVCSSKDRGYSKLPKEKAIYENLTLKSITFPSINFYTDTENYRVLCVEFINTQDISDKLVTNTKLFEQILQNYITFLKEIHSLERQQIPTNDLNDIDYFLQTRVQEVQFRDTLDEKYADDIEKTAKIARSLYKSERDTFIHGDLWPVNVGFSNNGIKTVFDWEMAAWADYTYDLAFIEATMVDRLVAHEKLEYTVQEARDWFRSYFNLSPNAVKSLESYKPWLLYLQYGNLINTQNGVPAYKPSTVSYEEASDVRRELLEESIGTVLNR
jgi:thiamine kinase-like enzyme